MTDLLRECALLVEAIDHASPGQPFTDADVSRVVATLEWALNLNGAGRVALARELGRLRARQEAQAGR